MKQIHLLFPFLFACLALPVFGQTTIDFDKIETPNPNAPRFNEPQGYQTLGLDVGLSYQTSDVRAAYGGWGIGLTYEKNLGHRTGGALDFGLRGRLMYANSKGLDKRATKGVRDIPLATYGSDSIFFANHLTHQGELAVEGVLTFNQLRERTGIYATLFGGIGIVGYDVKIDQLDGNNKKYNYKSLGATPSVSDVRALRDGTYETRRLGGDTLTFGFMPSIGGEIGFHVSPKFMIVLGHKWTFTGVDLFDGKEYIDNSSKGVRNDWHHYTNLQLKWILGERKRRQEYPRQPEPPRPQDPPRRPEIPQTPTAQLPTVRFTLPNSNFETTQDRFSIRVKIDYVAGYDNVNLSINGRDSRDFAFRNGELTADVPLFEGANPITVSARNATGSASDAVTITSRRTRAVAPTVQITSTGTPTTDNFGGCQTNIEARINNVTSRNDIILTLNGRDLTNFTFDNNSKILRGSLALAKGPNRVVINARNDVGNGSDERSITCTERPRQAAPTVQISQPTNGQFFENNPIEIRAKVENIANRSQIELSLDGNRITDFVYYGFDKSVTARVSVTAGEHQIRLVATNEGGSMEDAARFTLREKPRNSAPTVQILRPSNNARITESFVNLEAKVDNITDRNGIQVVVNGIEDRGFSFDIYTKIVKTRANIKDGQNTLTVRAQNETGQAEASVTVTKRGIIVPPPPPPPAKTPPTVQISNPTNGSRTADPSVNLVARVENVVQNQVKVLLNNQEVPFTMASLQIQAPLNLRKGDNTITVRGENNDGTAEKTVTVSYNVSKRLPDVQELPTDAGTLEQEPTITNFNASQPVIDPFDPKPAVSVVTATVGNVTNANQIEFYLNGAQQTNFTFDAATQQLRWSFQPKGGQSYTFNIVAKNGVGRASKTEVVKF